MMTQLKYLILFAIAGVLAYIVGTLLNLPMFAIVLSIALIVLSLYVAYLFFARIVEPTPDNIIGAMLVILLLAIAPAWLISMKVALSFVYVFIIPLVVLLILSMIFKEIIRGYKTLGAGIL